MKLRLGFSPCPNDTFIFDALVNDKIDTEELAFDVFLEDVETLNQWAAEGKLDITKLSFPALFQNTDKYITLSSGAALGKGVGPLLIAKKMVAVPAVANCTVAVPGLHTTANFLLHYAFPQIQNRTPMLFSDIENAVLEERVDLGVIIHENRFTYRQKGLLKICDLGEVWEQKEGVPIPLGCIAAKRTLDEATLKKVDALIEKSVQRALAVNVIPDYTRQHAQEMNEEVMRQHIELYVNDFSQRLGAEGEKAVMRLYDVYRSIQNPKASFTPPVFRK